jgi:hypothetical protein
MSQVNLVDVIHSDGIVSQQVQVLNEDGSSNIYIKEIYDAQQEAIANFVPPTGGKE